MKKFRHIKETLKTLCSYVLLIFVVYFIISIIGFRFRHPWATETECLVNVFNALTWTQLDYREMRLR
jgi:hypothetical protein